MKNKRIIKTVAAIILTTLVLSFLISQLNVYKLSPYLCTVLLHTTPEEFCESDGSETDLAIFGYTYAKVDRDGNLFLILTNRQKQRWKNSYFYLHILQKVLGDTRDIGITPSVPTDETFKTFYDNSDECGYEISEDYTKIISEPDDSLFFYLVIPYACIAMQFFNDVPTDKIRCEFIKVDENNNIIETIIWPDDIPSY